MANVSDPSSERNFRLGRFVSGAGESPASIFYRSMFSPRDLTIGSEQITGPRYFFYLCGVYLLLPLVLILGVSYLWGMSSPETAPMEALAAPLIGIQAVLLLPLLFVSNLLLAKIVVRISASGHADEARDLLWLLASNYFFILGTPLAIGVVMGNLEISGIDGFLEQILGPVLAVALVGFAVLWLRSAAVLVQSHRTCTSMVAYAVAVGGAVAIVLMAWLTIGITGLAILLPLGLLVA